MTISVEVGSDAVAIRFTGPDQLWTLSKGILLPYADILSVGVESRSVLQKDLGWRVGGGYFPGRMATGHFLSKTRRGARQLWAVYRDTELLVIETRRDRPHRVVLQTPDRENLARIISSRLQ